VASQDGDGKSSVKHEFLDGMILAMAGGTPDYAALAAAVTASLNRQLEGKRSRVQRGAASPDGRFGHGWTERAPSAIDASSM
jgi:hypothetical protein